MAYRPNEMKIMTLHVTVRAFDRIDVNIETVDSHFSMTNDIAHAISNDSYLFRVPRAAITILIIMYVCVYIDRFDFPIYRAHHLGLNSPQNR